MSSAQIPFTCMYKYALLMAAPVNNVTGKPFRLSPHYSYYS